MVAALIVISCGDNLSRGTQDAPSRDAPSAGDAPSDGIVDAVADAAIDAVPDAPADAATDAAIDAPADAATDAATDASTDAAIDAPADAVADAAIDAPPVDTTPPAVIAVMPIDGAGGVWLHDWFAVTFSEPVVATTLTTQSLRLLDPSDQNLSSTVIVSADARTAYVRTSDSAAMIGALRLEVGTAITDLAGNALAQAAPFSWTLAAWARPASGLDLGASPHAPALAVTATDVIVIATSIDSGAGRRIAVVDATGAPLGGTLGSGDAITPVLASPGPVVAWADATTQTIEAARWTGAAWIPLPSPGAGRLPALAASPGGAIGIVWVDANDDLASARLVADTWQIAAAPIAGSVVTEVPALAMPDDATLVAAFVDRGVASDRVRAVTITGSVVERPALVLRTPPVLGVQHGVSIDARGGTVAIAWDEYSGHMFSGHVALANGGGWSILPALDVDAPGNTRAPAVQLDATGAPVAVFTERVEGAYRGFAVRWSGMQWQAIGGDAWNASATIAPGRPAFRLWHDRVPVVAWKDSGAATVQLARFNGPATARPGLASRASLAGCAFNPASPPATLSATGCFAIAGGVATPHAGLVPYDLQSELWSDGALKRRWLGVPSGSLTALANGSFDAPVGSFVVKEFAIDDPGARTIVETRFLARTVAGWQGFSYRWRANGSDADLLPGNASTTTTWPLSGGGTHVQIYPSRAQCQRCHVASIGPLLGVRPDQLTRRFDYAGVLDDQPRVLGQLGLATFAVAAHPAPHDPRTPLEQRVRGYLSTNCAHCHNPAGERPQQDFRLQTPLASTGLCPLIAAGDPSGSRLYQRDTSRPGMPPIATDIVDPLVVDIEAQWIGSLTTCP